FFLIMTFLFVGVYHDPEFSSDVTLFTKHRPAVMFDFKDNCAGDKRKLTPAMRREVMPIMNLLFNTNLLMALFLYHSGYPNIFNSRF
ncbi:MAG: hypothetical protein ACXWV6_05125, partial [Chitinophagaceae bacterium]